jgi:hypothetical protein
MDANLQFPLSRGRNFDILDLENLGPTDLVKPGMAWKSLVNITAKTGSDGDC